MKKCSCKAGCQCVTCTCTAYAEAFDALGNPNRMRIISELSSGPRNVSQLMQATGLGQTCTSHCLRQLAERRFVTVTSAGKHRVYRVNRQAVEPLLRTIAKHVRVPS